MSAWLRLPTLRALTARLRDMNEAFKHPDGGLGEVYLYWEGWSAFMPGFDRHTPVAGNGEWCAGCHGLAWPVHVGPETVPGDDTFDAVAAARRLLAAAKDAGFK